MRKMHVLMVAMLLPLCVAQADDNVADYIAAQAVMQRATQQLLDRLKTHFKTYAEDEQRFYRMLEEVVLPVIDMRLISRLVLGAHWKTVNDLQKERFVKNFQMVLMKSYGKTLLLLPDIHIEYMPSPAREENQSRKKHQIVNTKIMTSDNKPPLSVNYALKNREGWKVFDIIIDGTSIVRQFRDGFDQEIREVGFNALLERLGKSGAASANS